MRLKKLVIVGFKSFADKTTLQFDPGITCIVGPNGCGKSNIADAFRWVLGEQSAKSMRGHKMPDVIFAGTSHRKPLNVAEVSMTLTDIQGALPIDYEEVTITRRLHRSGESEYLLNGNVVRLKDVQNLFLDSGIGRNAFSIFEQGKIDQVINYSSVERRYIFEEAAGILRFLQRKKEALRRFEQADLNLSRIKDIHKEVERQIVALRQQAEKARSFKENKMLLESLEKSYCLARWNMLEKKWQELEGRQHGYHEAAASIQKEIEGLQGKGRECRADLAQLEKNWKAKSEELFALKTEKEILLRDQQAALESFKNAQQKDRKLKQQLEELKVAQQLRQKSNLELGKKQKQLKESLESFEGQFKGQKGDLKAQEQEVAQMRLQMQQKQQEYIKKTRDASLLENDSTQLRARLEASQEKKKEIDERKQKVAQEKDGLTVIILEKKEQLQTISDVIDAHKERLEQFEDELQRLNKGIDAKRKELELMQKKNLEYKARQKILLRMRDELEGFSSGSKALLKESQSLQSPLYGKIQPLYELIRSEADVADAVSAALRNYAQTLVVQNRQDFKEVLTLAKREKLHDYSIYCLENKSPISSKLASSSLLNYLAGNSAVSHFLKDVHILPSYEEALNFASQNPGCQVWIEEGGFIDHQGVLFNCKASENHVFLREAELKGLEKELEAQESLLNSLEKDIQLIMQKKMQLQLERTESDQMLRRDEMKLVEVNFGLQRALGDQEKAKEELNRLEKECAFLAEQMNGQSQQCERLKDQLQQAKQDLQHVVQQFEDLEKKLQKHADILQSQQEVYQEKEKFLQDLQVQERQFAHELKVLEVKEQESLNLQLRIEEELEELQHIQSHVEIKEGSFKNALEQLESKLADKQKQCMQLEVVLSQTQEQIGQIEKEVVKRQQDLHKTEQESHQIGLQAAQHRSAAEAIEQELRERHELSLAEARATLPLLEKSLEQTDKQIKSLRQAIQEAGDVNMTAIEDLEQNEQRFLFLNRQMDDMTSSKNELTHIIAELDRESRKLFTDTFEAIRANFKKNFQILFNGGEADLHFTEADNILEAGIEISAKPPGKQMRSISLLSGGEKCLTAVALLFAIFEVKPSPFCILDEIDAPLDDTNVERFVNVVKHFVDRCQFLIITHNKRTMAIGDVLFGVSMEEKGVSKLLSLEFAKHQPEASLV